MSNNAHDKAAQEQHFADIFARLHEQDIEQFYAHYQLWVLRRRLPLLEKQIEALREHLAENQRTVELMQPSALALAVLVRLQSSGVNDTDVLDAMLDRGEDWLDRMMQRLDYCEQVEDFIQGDYTQWCIRSLEGAYDWIDSLLGSIKENDRPLKTPSGEIVATEEQLLQKLSLDEETPLENTLKQPAVPPAVSDEQVAEVVEALEPAEAVEVVEAAETPEVAEYAEVVEATETPEAAEVVEATETPEAAEVLESVEEPLVLEEGDAEARAEQVGWKDLEDLEAPEVHPVPWYSVELSADGSSSTASEQSSAPDDWIKFLQAEEETTEIAEPVEEEATSEAGEAEVVEPEVIEAADGEESEGAEVVELDGVEAADGEESEEANEAEALAESEAAETQEIEELEVVALTATEPEVTEELEAGTEEAAAAFEVAETTEAGEEGEEVTDVEVTEELAAVEAEVAGEMASSGPASVEALQDSECTSQEETLVSDASAQESASLPDEHALLEPVSALSEEEIVLEHEPLPALSEEEISLVEVALAEDAAPGEGVEGREVIIDEAALAGAEQEAETGVEELTAVEEISVLEMTEEKEVSALEMVGTEEEDTGETLELEIRPRASQAASGANEIETAALVNDILGEEDEQEEQLAWYEYLDLEEPASAGVSAESAQPAEADQEISEPAVTETPQAPFSGEKPTPEIYEYTIAESSGGEQSLPLASEPNEAEEATEIEGWQNWRTSLADEETARLPLKEIQTDLLLHTGESQETVERDEPLVPDSDRGQVTTAEREETLVLDNQASTVSPVWQEDSAPVAQAPRVQPAPAPEAPPQKVGFWRRLFGFGRKKKQR